MLKFNLLRPLALVSSLIIAHSATAGDNPVNCRTVTDTITVYSGTASCTAYSGSESRVLSQSFYRSPTATVFLSEGRFSCTDRLTTARKETISRNVCDYTPQAGFRHYIIHDGTAYTASLRLSSNARDRDGHIARTEWWVNGSSYGSSVPTLSVTQPTNFNIKQRVTDDDGYTDETSGSVFVSPANDPCLEGVSSC